MNHQPGLPLIKRGQTKMKTDRQEKNETKYHKFVNLRIFSYSIDM